MLLVQVAFSTPAVSATDFSKVGVRSGDWAQYKVSESVNRTLASKMNFPIGSLFSGRENLVFTNVTGTIVTINITLYNLDGSENSSRVVVGNVSNSLSTQYVKGYGNFTLPIMWENIIPANLSAHDPIYSGASMSINETKPMTVGNVSRVANHVNLTSIINSTTYYKYSLYWDKQTGLMVSVQMYLSSLQLWVNESLIVTSLWQNSIGVSMVQVLLVGGVIAVVAFASGALVIYRRRRNPSPSIISEPQQP
jgi:hypothetical protein